MNINRISFQGTHRNPVNGFSKSYSRRNNNTKYQDEFKHSEILTPRYNNKNNKNSKKVIAIPLATATIGTTMALILTFGSPSSAEPPKTITFNPNETTISEIAEENDCNLEFLLDYNNIDQNTDPTSIKEITIPNQYDYIENEITAIEEKIKKSNLNEKQLQELESKLNALKTKQTEQKNVAQTYTDGKYVFITINMEENDIDEKYKYGINVETLKKLFDIKDGAIREHNALDVRWEAYENGEGGYMDYTYNWFHNGDIIKVPVSAIKTNNINLTQYLEE